MVDGGVGGRGSGGCTACFDDGSAAGCDGGNVFLSDPSLFDQFSGGFAVHCGVEQVWVHRVVVVTPNSEVFDFFDCHAKFFGQHGFGAVVVQASEGVELLWGHVGGVFHGDEGVGVGWVAGDENFGFGGDFVERGALTGEDFPVGGKEVGAVHAFFAGHGTYEHGTVDVFEDFFGVVTDFDVGEGGEGAVVEFHDDAFESR